MEFMSFLHPDSSEEEISPKNIDPTLANKGDEIMRAL